MHTQVPFLKVANMGGKPVQNAVTAAAKPFASMLLGASGAQFFLHDSVDGQAPLLVSKHRLLFSHSAHACPLLQCSRLPFPAHQTLCCGMKPDCPVVPGRCHTVTGAEGAHAAAAPAICGLVWKKRMHSDASRCTSCYLLLQARMTQDIPGDGYYFSAVKAFITRTAYANIRGDQMVGWANSSLRAPKDLPDVSSIRGRGIVLETPLEDALHPSDRRPAGPEHSAASSRSTGTSAPSRASELPSLTTSHG